MNEAIPVIPLLRRMTIVPCLLLLAFAVERAVWAQSQDSSGAWSSIRRAVPSRAHGSRCWMNRAHLMPSVTTDAEGRFSLPVSPGRYLVRVQLAPFSPSQVPVLVASDAQPKDLRITLLVGGVEERVAVTSSVPYTPPSTASTAKAGTPTFETPISLQTVPRQLLEDQQAIRPRDALRNVSGVDSGFGFGLLRDRSIIRGFETDQFPQGGSYLDGVLQFEAINSLANVERVEVLKGASALLYGRIEPGGLIDYVTKRPQASRFNSVQQQAGSFGNWRTTIDSTGRIGDSDAVQYRANVEFFDTDSFRDRVFTRSAS